MQNWKSGRSNIGNRFERLAGVEPSEASVVTIKWSEALESAFDYYYSEYTTAWALNETPLNKAGDVIFIHKKSGIWVGWETISLSDRPDVATLFDLMPDLPVDKIYWQTVRKLREKGMKEPENYFWENIFSYEHIDEIQTNTRKYGIDWEA